MKRTAGGKRSSQRSIGGSRALLSMVVVTRRFARMVRPPAVARVATTRIRVAVFHDWTQRWSRRRKSSLVGWAGTSAFFGTLRQGE